MFVCKGTRQKPSSSGIEHRLPRMKVVGSNPTEGKICFSHFTLFRVECEELFWKTNIKLLKLIKQIKSVKKMTTIHLELLSEEPAVLFWFGWRNYIKTADGKRSAYQIAQLLPSDAVEYKYSCSSIRDPVFKYIIFQSTVCCIIKARKTSFLTFVNWLNFRIVDPVISQFNKTFLFWTQLLSTFQLFNKIL